MRHYTRFRAYQLGEEGSSFSLRVDNHFTLIDAKVTETSIPNIIEELGKAFKTYIDVLHITSWDIDHCDASSLAYILRKWSPRVIEYPTYRPDTESGWECLSMIRKYSIGEKVELETWRVYNSFNQSIPFKGSDVLLNPIRIDENSNDNSNAKLFREGSFHVLSLGDCEAEDISSRLQEHGILQGEVDVLLLAHHGSENSICTKEFLGKLSPRIAICATNYDNRFGHPHPRILSRLSSLGIPLFTTKTGDVVVESIDKCHFRVYNYTSNNTTCSIHSDYPNKTYYTND